MQGAHRALLRRYTEQQKEREREREGGGGLSSAILARGPIRERRDPLRRQKGRVRQVVASRATRERAKEQPRQINERNLLLAVSEKKLPRALRFHPFRLSPPP